MLAQNVRFTYGTTVYTLPRLGILVKVNLQCLKRHSFTGLNQSVVPIFTTIMSVDVLNSHRQKRMLLIVRLQFPCSPAF